MKRLIPLLLVFVLLLGGCVTANTVHDPVETEAGGQKVVVQYDDGSISTGTVTAENGDVYRFEAYFGTDGTSADFIYPDGVRRSAAADKDGTITYDTFFVDYGEHISQYGEYINANALLKAVTEAKPFTISDLDLNWELIGLALLIGVFSLVAYFNPEGMWEFFIGWRFRDADPSDASISTYRVLGILGIVVAVIMLFIGLFF